MTRRFKRIPALALALALPLLAVPGPSASEPIIWMRVEINRPDMDRPHVKVSLPLTLIEVVVDSIDKGDLMAHIEDEHDIDIPKMWREIRKAEIDEFITIETEDEQIKVWKDRDFFRLNVAHAREGDGLVEMKIPLEVMDYVFESRSLDFQELVSRLRGHLPLTLIEVKKDPEHVKIWLEEE